MSFLIRYTPSRLESTFSYTLCKHSPLRRRRRLRHTFLTQYCTICRSTHYLRRKDTWGSATLSATRPALRPCLFVAEVRDLVANP